jgi:argininosuccinate lyase
MFRDTALAAGLVAAAMCGAEFNRERMAERARLGWITATELADTLTRDHGVPFKVSHRVTARFIAEAARRLAVSNSLLLSEITEKIVGRPIV